MKGSTRSQAKIVKKRKAAEGNQGDQENSVATQPSPQVTRQPSKVNKISNPKKPKLQQNKNNSKRSSDLMSVPEGIFPSVEEVNKKVIPHFTREQVQKYLADQFDQIDREFAYSGGQEIQVAVTANDENEFLDIDSDDDGFEPIPRLIRYREERGEGSQASELNQERRDSQEQGSTASTEVVFRNTVEDFEALRGVPAFESFLKKVREEEKKAEEAECRTKKNQPASKRQNTGNVVNNTIKSPSDTTIYTPAFARDAIANNQNQGLVFNSPTLAANPQQRSIFSTNQAMLVNPVNTNTLDSIDSSTLDNVQVDANIGLTYQPNGDITNQIIKFIEGIRVQGDDNRRDRPRDAGSGDSQRQMDKVELASQKASKGIIQAEQHRATVNIPTGNPMTLPSPVVDPPLPNINVVNYTSDLDIDDQFFHVTCHLDEGLKAKIQCRQFVELERLLPKTKSRGGNDNRMDLVYCDGHSYFVPSTPENRINGVRKWEQAFRVYATVYSQANPLRAAKIWQYVHTINTAASAYIWENVSQYDITFRHLMSQYPNRSWAKIYNQMWNLAMRDSIPKNNHFGQTFPRQGSNNQNTNVNQHGTSSNKTNNSKPKAKKPNYCWTFQRGFCKSGASCPFVNRCSYCDATDHGLNACPKAKESAKENNSKN